jgi:hypothetical protein
MLVFSKPGANLSQESAGQRIGHLLFATHPHLSMTRIDSERHPRFLALRVHEKSRSWAFEDAPFLCRLGDNPSVYAADRVGWPYSHGIAPLE